MSTNDVPGANPKNGDALKVGCWGEHEDGSLILVEGTEGGRVIYSLFAMNTNPITEYRDAMPTWAFNNMFSWNKDTKNIKWTWHDKTQFPWNKVIKKGARDGVRYASAHDQQSAAQMVAEDLRLRGQDYNADMNKHKTDDKRKLIGMRDKLKAALDTLDQAIELGDEIHDSLPKNGDKSNA